MAAPDKAAFEEKRGGLTLTSLKVEGSWKSYWAILSLIRPLGALIRPLQALWSPYGALMERLWSPYGALMGYFIPRPIEKGLEGLIRALRAL